MDSLTIGIAYAIFVVMVSPKDYYDDPKPKNRTSEGNQYPDNLYQLFDSPDLPDRRLPDGKKPVTLSEKFRTIKAWALGAAAVVAIVALAFGLSKEGDAAKNIPFNQQLLDALKNPGQIELTYADIEQIEGTFELKPGVKILFSPEHKTGQDSSFNVEGETGKGTQVDNPIVFESQIDPDHDKFVGFVIEDEKTGDDFMGYVNANDVVGLDGARQTEFDGSIRPTLEQE